MLYPMNRRNVLSALLSIPAAGFATRALAACGEQWFGKAEPFDFQGLAARAQELARRPYSSAGVRGGALLERIDFDAHQKIRFRDGCSLWGGDGAPPVQFFHLGRYFKEPVAIYTVSGGQAREVLYTPELFDMPRAHVARELPRNIGFAGLRVMEPGLKSDWVSFLGASYFRSAGALDQYGLSARGIAVNAATPGPEEFPRFTAFWLEPHGDSPDALTVYALLDGPSISGAYRMAMRKGEKGVVMDVDKRLFLRKGVERLGIAPLTSMFWYSETDRPRGADWRPEIHDSDGLAIWTGSGERVWRPLVNQREVRTNSFSDTDPRGFGLLQRDRDFKNYQDDGVFYEKRPSVWVEPLGRWGEGSVQLVEIPTDDEIHDNIVAFWVPRSPPAAGQALSFSYRLHWLADEPYPAKGRVVATRMGRGGVPGQPRPDGLRKFVIDFAGRELAGFGKDKPVEAVVTASNGEVGKAVAFPVVGQNRWRAIFDVSEEGVEPVNLRCYLKLGDRALTETWLYQFTPRGPGETRASRAATPG